MNSRRAFLFEFTAIPTFFIRQSLESIELQVYRGINVQREAAGLDPLRWSGPLCLCAREHSRRMIEVGFFGHEDPDRGGLQARMAAAGVVSLRCGENVFRASRFPDPAALAVIAWMYSDGHRRNLLTPDFRFTGVGAAFGAGRTVAVTQQFLLPFPAKAIRSARRELPGPR